MRIRLAWVAMLALVAVGFLLACSTKYSNTNNGLVVVPTQGSAVMQSFSLNLGNGHLSQINNASGPPINGISSSIVLDPAGAFAYVIVNQNPAVAGSSTGIETFQIASDGKLSAVGTASVTNPVALAIDSAGKYLFVAQGIDGTVSVFSTSSSGSLTAVGSPVSLPLQAGGQVPSASALAVTPTVYPAQFAFCSGQNAPSTENLYVVDSANYFVLNYSVDMSTGALGPPSTASSVQAYPTGAVPAGVAVDPCNRFVYVSNSNTNNVSAYNICSAVSQNCSNPDFSLLAMAGSPFAISPGDRPGPIAVDPYAKFLYVVDSGSSQLTAFSISASSGALTSIATYATSTGANSIAIRSDDVWLFVANSTSSTLSQYAITPATGVLTPQTPTTTFNTPTGVAVK